ncbi:hypothetical protein ME121_4648 [Methylobacterium sp. ME121]|jgi:hypothetical protein|nr:hypothetical protein ME121_4648 [Methylobacterium sp. ME121]
MRCGRDQSLLLQAAQETAHQAGIETEIGADLADLRAPRPDGVQDARRPQGTASAEERGVERADLGGDGAGEAADAGDLGRIHGI